MASGGNGGTDGSSGSCPTSLGTPDTNELIRLRLMVPPGCRLPHIFRITADGYPTRGPGATPDELRRHEGGCWNIVGRIRFWRGKDFWKVVGQARREWETGGSSSAPRRPRRRPPAATPSPSGGHAVFKLLPPSEAAAAAEAREAAELQAALDTAVAMAAAAKAAELQAALDASAGMGTVQAPPQTDPVEDDAVDWDAGGKSSDDDDGDGGAGEIVDLAASDDE
ncbi:hypothetical protein VPH35_101413 [Triticum aestivum]